VRRFPKFIVQIRISCWVGVATACALSMPVCAHAQTAKPTEYQIKAAYLYHFIRFVTWPANAAATQTNTVPMCIFGNDPFGTSLEAAGKGLVIDGKRTSVRRIPTAEAATHCGVLFIGVAAHPPLDQVIAAVGKRGVLTVSDLPEFTRRGGIIQFVVEGGRIRFEVNLAAAAEAGLTLSSELLKVALAVRWTLRPGA
jgi:hypothetical protein